MHRLKNIIFPITLILFVSCSKQLTDDVIQKKVCDRLVKYQADESEHVNVIQLLFGKHVITEEGKPLFISKNHKIKIDKVEIFNSEEIEISNVTKIKIKVSGAANTFYLKRKLDYPNSCYVYTEEDYREIRFENTLYAIFWNDDSGNWSCDLSVW